MDVRPTLRSALADPGWRYAIVAGITALPLTLTASLSSDESISLGGPFLAGIVVGSCTGLRQSTALESPRGRP